MAESSFRRLVKGAFFYTLLGFLPLAARLVLFPVFVRYLTPFDYGLISLTNTLTSAVTILAVFGLESAFGYYYFVYRKTPELLRTYFSTLLTSVLVLGSVLLALGWMFGPALVGILFKDPAFTYLPFGQISLVVAVTTAVNTLVLSYYRNSQQPEKYFAVAVTAFALSLGAEAVAILVLHQGAQGVLIARLLGAAVVAVVVIGYVYSTGGVRFSRRMLLRSLGYGLPVLVYLFFGFIYNSYDRILIENFLTIPQVAIFSTAFTIASVLEIFMQAFEAATYPTIYELYRKDPKANRDAFNRVVRLQGWTMLTIAALILLPTPAFIRWVPPVDYLPAMGLVPILLIGFLFRFYYTTWIKPLFFVARNTRLLPWLNVVCGVAVVGLNVWLLPILGLMGAAIAMVGARLVQLAFAAWLYYRQTQVRFELGWVNLCFVLLFAYLVTLSLVELNDLRWQTLAFGVPLVLVFIGAATLWVRVLGLTLRPDWARLKQYV